MKLSWRSLKVNLKITSYQVLRFLGLSHIGNENIYSDLNHESTMTVRPMKDTKRWFV